MSFLKSFFGNYSKRELKRINPIVDKILSLEDTYKKMTDAELREQSDKFRERLKTVKLPMIFFQRHLLSVVKLATVFLVCVTSLYSLLVV